MAYEEKYQIYEEMHAGVDTNFLSRNPDGTSACEIRSLTTLVPSKNFHILSIKKDQKYSEIKFGKPGVTTPRNREIAK